MFTSAKASLSSWCHDVMMSLLATKGHRDGRGRSGHQSALWLTAAAASWFILQLFNHMGKTKEVPEDGTMMDFVGNIWMMPAATNLTQSNGHHIKSREVVKRKILLSSVPSNTFKVKMNSQRNCNLGLCLIRSCCGASHVINYDPSHLMDWQFQWKHK